VLPQTNPSPEDRDARQQLHVSHQLEKLEENIVVVKEASSLLFVDGAKSSIDLLEHSNNLLFQKLGYIGGLFPGHGEEDVETVLDVLVQL